MEGKCPICNHPWDEHTGRDGECRHDYESHIERPKEQCLCINGLNKPGPKAMRETNGTVLE